MDAESAHEEHKKAGHNELKQDFRGTVKVTRLPKARHSAQKGQRQEQKPDHLVPEGPEGADNLGDDMVKQVGGVCNETAFGHTSMIARSPKAQFSADR